MKKQIVTVTLAASLSFCLVFCAGCAKNGKTAAVSSTETNCWKAAVRQKTL